MGSGRHRSNKITQRIFMRMIRRRRSNLAAIHNITTVGLKIHLNWCTLPYHNHPKGCPLFDSCKHSFYKIHTYDNVFDRSAVAWCIWEEFDLKKQEEKMHSLHPEWTPRQCRNLLYWQGTVRKKLNIKVKEFFKRKKLWKKYACVTRGFGINIYATLKTAGVHLEPIKNIQTVKSVCLICKYKNENDNDLTVY